MSTTGNNVNPLTDKVLRPSWLPLCAVAGTAYMERTRKQNLQALSGVADAWHGMVTETEQQVDPGYSCDPG
jgi:hypothetical protein